MPTKMRWKKNDKYQAVVLPHPVLFPRSSTRLFGGRFSQPAELCFAQAERRCHGGFSLPPHSHSVLGATTSARDTLHRLSATHSSSQTGKPQALHCQQLPRGKGTAWMDHFQTSCTVAGAEAGGELLVLGSAERPAATGPCRHFSAFAELQEAVRSIGWCETGEQKIPSTALAGDSS